MEETNANRAVALIDSALLALVRTGCMNENEADGLGWLLLAKTPSATELRSLIIELEDRALSCDKVSYDQALAVIRLLREAWKEVNGHE